MRKKYGKLLREAEEKIETLILGENEKLDEVRHDLVLITEIPDTGISVSWQMDRSDVLEQSGKDKRG